MIKTLFLLVSLYLVHSQQTYGFITTYNDSSCSSSSATALVGAPIGSCVQFNATHYKIYQCLAGNLGYNETICTDSACTQNCFLSDTTTGSTTCTAGNGAYFKVFCNRLTSDDPFEVIYYTLTLDVFWKSY